MSTSNGTDPAGLSIRLSVVIPVYQSEETLRELYQNLVVELEDLGSFEIIFVEDCGKDDSWSRIVEITRKDARVRGIKLARNSGQHNALLAGIREGRGDLIITMDDDFQNPPAEIKKLLAAMTDETDVVYGRPEKEQHGIFRDLASKLTKWALREAMGAKTAVDISPFRIFRTRLRAAFANYENPMVNIDVLLTWGMTRFKSITVEHRARERGVSGYTFRNLVNHAFNMMTGFSTFPLRFCSAVGFVFSFIGLVLLVFVVGRYFLEGTSNPGFPFLASIIIIFSGVQLFAVGVIGEYLTRMHFRMMDRPAYIVGETTEELKG